MDFLQLPIRLGQLRPDAQVLGIRSGELGLHALLLDLCLGPLGAHAQPLAKKRQPVDRKRVPANQNSIPSGTTAETALSRSGPMSWVVPLDMSASVAPVAKVKG